MSEVKRKADSALYYYELERTVEDILYRLGYDVGQNISSLGSAGALEATVGGRRYDVYIVGSRERRVPDDRIKFGSATMQIVVGEISDRMRAKLPDLFPDEIVLDLRNLLYLVGNRSDLRDALVSVLNFSVDDVVPLAPDPRSVPDPRRKDPGEAGTQSEVDRLETLLKNWTPGRASSMQYEALCCEILKKLFANDLALWREQQTSDAGLFRFDLICKIKKGNDKDFWEIAERYFRSKYIVFEFKNYTGKVTQKEVFTTVKYLYAKALRGIAILLSPHGTDAHADMAIRGILRDEGKLILSLSHQDLEKMLEGQKKGGDPADYLSDKLDELLIDLEK